ncbi:MAG: protein kinase [Myxococcales bacterium]|nr:protein kinase [Myxococcales bacterium]
MGVVLEARHVELDRRVAIKVLHAELRAHPELLERFLREGRAASKIEGDHVARVLDVDRLPDGTPFLVMEYLDGEDLSSVRKARRPLPVAEVVDYVLQACEAISQAHRAGIIHRDLLPGRRDAIAHGMRQCRESRCGETGADEPPEELEHRDEPTLMLLRVKCLD